MNTKSLLLKRAERADNFISVFTQAILSTFETERIWNGLRSPEMANLLGSSCSRYSGMIHDHRLPSQQVMLRFFYIFGYDFQSSLALEKTRDNLDHVREEIGNLVTGLSDDQINAIIRAIENTPALDHTKYNYAYLFCSALRNFMSSRDAHGEELEKLDTVFPMSDKEIELAEEYCNSSSNETEYEEYDEDEEEF